MATYVAPAATPLPAPAQPNWSTLLLQAAANAAPGASPAVTAHVAAASASPDDAVDNVQAANQYMNVAQSAQKLSEQTVSVQNSFFNSLPKSVQAQYKSAGYKLPGEHRGLLGGITHDLGTATSAALSGAKRGASDALNALGAPLRAVQHAYRAAEVVATGQAGTQGPIWGGTAEGGSPGAPLSALVSVKDWARAWNETSNGEKYIMPAVERAVAKQYGQQTYQLALKLATGTTAQQIVKSAPANQQAALQQKIDTDEQLHQAVTALNNGHISFGRSLVGEHFLTNHPLAGRLISGSADAAFDWFGDPVNIGAKAYQGVKAARYIVRTGEDVNRLYDSSSAVRRAMGDIADHVRTDSTGDLLRRYPKLQTLIRGLVQAEADTAEKVRDFFAANQNVTALITDNSIEAPAISGGGAIIPYLTYSGQARLAAKGALTRAVDWMADNPARITGVQPSDIIGTSLNPYGPINRIETTFGRAIRRFTTLAPSAHGATFDPQSPDALTHLRDIAMTFLPRGRADTILNEFAKSTDLGDMKKIYMNLMREVGHAAGMDSSPDIWHAYMNRFSSLDETGIADSRAYTPGDIDRIAINGIDNHVAGVLEQHMTNEWAVPDFKLLYAQAKKVGLLRATVGKINSPYLDKFMNVWRTAVLTRPGFGLRIAADEGLIGLLRIGPTAYAKSLLATAAMKASGRLNSEDLNDIKDSQLYQRWLGRLSASSKSRITNVPSFIVEHSVDAYRRAMVNVADKLSDDEMRDAMGSLVRHDVFAPGGAVSRKIAAVEQHQAGYGVAGELGRKTAQFIKHGKIVNAEISGTGAYKDYRPADEIYTYLWQRDLSQLHDSAWARESLSARNEDATTRLSRVADKLEDDPIWKKSIRSTQDRAGRSVPLGEITSRAAALDHADVINQMVDALIQDPDGNEIPDLADMLLNAERAPTVDQLEAIPVENRPPLVHGPETVLVEPNAKNIFNRSSDYLFSHVIGPQIDWMVRKPLFWDAYAKSRKALQPMASKWREMMSEENADELLHEAAMTRAFNLVTPYIHNPELKSQFSTVTRNLAPFWFAQEQFYKRWARSFSFAPWSVRQLQLINNGIHNSGIVHKDPETGAEYFVYPGSAATQDVITRVLSHFGMKSTLPIEGALTGQVNEVTPGLERLGLPNTGPLVTIPMDGLKRLDPHMTGAVNYLQGGAAANENMFQQVMPTTFNRILDLADPTAFDNRQYASAQMQAIQYLEATGHGLGTVASHNLGQTVTPGNPSSIMAAYHGLKAGDYVTDASGNTWVYQPDGQWQQNSAQAEQNYLERVRNWTRIFLGVRLLFGFSVPASPEMQFDPSHLSADLQQYMNDMPMDQALQAFVQAHPDASAYTTFQTSTTGGPLPATNAAMSWINSHESFIHNHADAAFYFLPTKDSQGNFSDTAYQTQLAEGLRTRKTPSQFWSDVVYNQAATVYYKMEDLKNQYLKQPPSGYSKTDVEDEWTQWSQQFQQANPIFAEQLQTKNGAANRQNIMADVGRALNDPTLPVTTTSNDIAGLYNMWLAWQQKVGNYGNPDAPSLSTQQLDQYNLAFAQESQAYVNAHPDTQALYLKAIRPDLSSVLNNYAGGY